MRDLSPREKGNTCLTKFLACLASKKKSGGTKTHLHTCRQNYNVFIKILKTCKDTEKMIALKNNRVDKWNSKWNKIYLWLVFRRIQIWSLLWFSFYVIRHCTCTNDGLIHCFHYNVHVLYHCFYVFVRDMIL